MASVSSVLNTEFRTNLFQPANGATEGEDPFSLLLNSVADVKAGVQRPEAPKVAERRADAPAKPPKPETDADRQAKRQTKDATKPEATAQPDSTAPASTNAAGEDDEEVKTGGDGTSDADALLLAALGEPQQQAAAAEVSDDAGPLLTIAAGTQAETEIATATAAAPVSTMEAAAKTEAAVQITALSAGASAKPKPEAMPLELQPAALKNDKAPELMLPKVAAEAISSLAKPQQAAVSAETQVQFSLPQGNVQAASPATLQGPAHLEMLNAAISKHVQLAAGLETIEQAPELPKPLVSSNAVVPNFALTAQVNAPVQVQTQTAVETARSVPLDQLAVEIATRASKGERRFDIRLDPPELGRIDVRLEIDHKGNTTTKLIVERAETLDMLQRDARGLEKALQNAGLKTDAGGMQFSLQQDAQTHHGPHHLSSSLRGEASDLVQAEGESMAQVAVNDATLAAQLRGGVDIRI